jgi:hypothetical protein
VQQDLAAGIAAALARQDQQWIAARLSETVRLRALMPGGVIEAQGRENAAACLCGFLADFDAVEVVGSSVEPVVDRLLIHYRLHVAQGTTRWVCTQTAVCTAVDGLLSVVNLLCSGFREIGPSPQPAG